MLASKDGTLFCRTWPRSLAPPRHISRTANGSSYTIVHAAKPTASTVGGGSITVELTVCSVVAAAVTGDFAPCTARLPLQLMLSPSAWVIVLLLDRMSLCALGLVPHRNSLFVLVEAPLLLIRLLSQVAELALLWMSPSHDASAAADLPAMVGRSPHITHQLPILTAGPDAVTAESSATIAETNTVTAQSVLCVWGSDSLQYIQCMLWHRQLLPCFLELLQIKHAHQHGPTHNVHCLHKDLHASWIAQELVLRIRLYTADYASLATECPYVIEQKHNKPLSSLERSLQIDKCSDSSTV